MDALRTTGAEVRVLGYQRPDDPIASNADETCVGRRPIETSGAGIQALRWLSLALARGIPYSSAKYRSGALLKTVQQALADHPAAVFVDHAQLWFAIQAISASAVPAVFIAHNAEANSYSELAAKAASVASRWVLRREARLMTQAEAELARRATQVWTLTSADAVALRAIAPTADVRTLAVSSALTAPGAADQVCDIALLGTWSWRSNEVGLRWFSDRVVPLLSRELRIEVAGRGADWLHGRHPNVIVRGRIADAQLFLAQARVVAVPALAGSGIQIKTLDAIASGAPVVATGTAVRGIDALPGTVAVTDEPAEFAAHLQRLAAVTPERPDARAVNWSRQRAERFRDAIGSWSAELIDAAGGQRTASRIGSGLPT